MSFADPAKRRAYLKAYCARNAAKARARTAAWRAADPERTKASDRAAYLKRRKLKGRKPGATAEQKRNKRLANYAANKEKFRTRAREIKLRHRAKYTALQMLRKANQLRATPPWADKKAIREFYIQASATASCVDHIVPLQSEFVCGLHCEANLQILPMTENSAKGNRWWPDMP